MVDVEPDPRPIPAESNGKQIHGVFGDYVVIVKQVEAHHADLGGVNEVVIKGMILIQDGSGLPKSGWTFPFGPDWEKLVEDKVLPRIGDTLDNWWYFTGYCSNWDAQARLRDYSLMMGPQNTLNFELKYSTMWMYPPVACPSSVDPSELKLDLPGSLEMSTTMRTMMLYRKFNITDVSQAPPATDDESDSDMGGTAVNPAGGAPVAGQAGMMIDVPQIRIRMRIVQDTTVDGTSMQNAITGMETAIGCRNSTTFLGLSRGKIWCEGASIQKLEYNFYEVVYDFVYDAYFEHIQMPGFDGDSVPQIDDTGNYESVFWTRPTRQEVDFNDIFNDNAQLKELVTEGWWEMYSEGAIGITTGLCT